MTTSNPRSEEPKVSRRLALAVLGIGVPSAIAACSAATQSPSPYLQNASTPDPDAGGDPNTIIDDGGLSPNAQGNPATDVPSAWDVRAASLEANGIFSSANPGPWANEAAHHVPVVTMSGSTVTVIVDHPMTPAGDAGPEHYITTIYIRDQNHAIVGFHEFHVTDAAPSVAFTVPAATQSVVAYSNCNIHGLWTSDPGTGSDGGTTSDSSSDANSITGDAGSGNTDGGIDMTSQAAKYEATGLWSAAKEGPWVGKAPKHVPTVQLGSGAVLVTVNHEMMYPAGDAGAADSGAAAGHYIGAIYLRDQNNTVIAMKTFGPTDSFPVAQFTVPAGTTAITAYSWCNLHNAWMSAQIPVA